MTGSLDQPHPDGTATNDDLYATRPPWDIGRPQPPFRTLADTGALHGRVLDVGCGTGEHALLAAGLGLAATGIDLADTALDQARAKARDRGLTADFRHLDALRLAELDERFDTVLDCGLFHTLGIPDRAVYVAGLRAVLVPGGRYFMLGFSDRQPGDFGHPHKLTREEIGAAFADGWTVDSIEPATIEVTIDPAGFQGWFASVTRR